MITLTERAALEVKDLLQKHDKPNAMLRVFVSGGGCSGFSYGMALEEEVQEGDERLESSGIKMVVDPRSFQYVKGAEIDFVESLMGGGFKIENPNAVSSCGCGSSFTPREDGEEEVPAGGGGCGSCGSSGY